MATTIFTIMMGITMVAYTAAAKRVYHTDAAITGTAELRFASDLISRAIRSAPQPPEVSAGGLELTVIPEDVGMAIVSGGTNLDSNTKGFKSNQQLLRFDEYNASAATRWIFGSAGRPAGKVTTGQVGTYFRAPVENDLAKIFSRWDVVSIPPTRFGGAVTRTIDSISNNSGTRTLTFTAKLGVDVPEGTRIYAARRAKFAVVATAGKNTGELRYYPNASDNNQYRVIARDVDPSPRVDPTDPTSSNTTPFVLNGRTLALNLQKLPRGTVAGRTAQGIRTTVYARTDPTLP